MQKTLKEVSSQLAAAQSAQAAAAQARERQNDKFATPPDMVPFLSEAGNTLKSQITQAQAAKADLETSKPWPAHLVYAAHIVF